MERRFETLQAATARFDPPFAVVDLTALRENADLVRRARGLPIRIASTSVRCRAVLSDTSTRPGSGSRKLHVGVPRSPVHSVADARAAAEVITARVPGPPTAAGGVPRQLRRAPSRSGARGELRRRLRRVRISRMVPAAAAGLAHRLHVLRSEGAGEVQTPLRGPPAGRDRTSGE